MTPLNAEEAKICERLNLIRFYPKEHHDVILEDIAQFAGPEKRAERLLWLVNAARAAMKDGWRDDLRGLWCTRFKPADGREADCSLAGHTPADIEAENLAARAIADSPAPAALPAPAPWSNQDWESKLPLIALHCLDLYRKTCYGPVALILTGSDLLSDIRVKKLEPEENYAPPDWLKNL